MNQKKIERESMRYFYILWSTQSLSQLGSEMTNFALTLWLYQKTGSALQTALLSICSYAPYVLMSIFAGALSDKWNKKNVMLVSDTLAACATVIVFILLKANLLIPLHMYFLNALNGLMNTIQQPASDVAMTLLTPKKKYQRTSGLRSFSHSLITTLHPIFATALYAGIGISAVIVVDLLTFGIAFCALLFGIKLPKIVEDIKWDGIKKEPILQSAGRGLSYLKKNPMILYLISFLAGVNLMASAFDATLPAYILPRANGGETVLGMVTSCAGIATLVGSMIAIYLPRPKNRIRIITSTMLFSLTIENFLLAFSRTPLLWCIGQFLGWFVVPIMSTNMDVILRTSIPLNMQGRVYSCRNTLQFFTIPIGLFMGGFLVDQVWEPLMTTRKSDSLLRLFFGSGKGSGAAIMMFITGIVGAGICIWFGKKLKKYQFLES